MGGACCNFLFQTLNPKSYTLDPARPTLRHFGRVFPGHLDNMYLVEALNAPPPVLETLKPL